MSLRARAAFLLLALAAAAPAQQLWLAQNDDTSYGNLAVGWPASVLAFRFTAPTTDVVAAAQVFTGNAAPAPHTLELRDHDAVTGLPGTLLGPAGGWTTVHARCWQGAVLPQPVVLVGGQDYWLVWRTSGMFHQHSVSADAPGNTLGEVRISDGVTWHAQATLAGKFRLFTPYAAGSTQPFGVAKPGQYGAPAIGCSSWPALGSPLDLWLDDAARRQPALLLIGAPVPAGIPLPFGTSWTTADLAFFTLTNTHSSPFVGGATLSLPVPNDPGFAGVTLGFQWGVLDPLAADGIAHSAALQIALQ
ncbi:MAG: hypothetical protein AB7O97_14395 [Planctomycetota bacterium]